MSMLSKGLSLTIVLLYTTNTLLSDHIVSNVWSQTQGCQRMFPELKLFAQLNLHCLQCALVNGLPCYMLVSVCVYLIAI